MTVHGPERRGPERPGPDYPAEWDREPEEESVERTAEEWAAIKKLRVVDRDGWRRPGAPAWDAPITEAEFDKRAAGSTVDFRAYAEFEAFVQREHQQRQTAYEAHEWTSSDPDTCARCLVEWEDADGTCEEPK